MENYKKIWHSGDEKPQMYKDKITGHLLNTYCLCVFWYDGWNEALCRVTDEGNLEEVGTKQIWLPSDFSYWCYTYDITPVEIDERYLVDISVQEGH